MRIAGVSNFQFHTISNRLDLSSIKCAEVRVGNVTKSNQKNVYVSEGRLGETYSNKSMKENMENFFIIMRNLEVRETNCENKTIKLLSGETSQIRYDSSSNFSKMFREMKVIDIHI